MIPTPTQLLSEIEDGELPLADMFANANCESLLDQRDSDASFVATYRDICHQIETLKFILNRDPTEPIRNKSFLVVSNATSQHEIASCVSGDFMLIAWQSHALTDSAIPSCRSAFVDWLYSQYKSGKFPCPPYSNGSQN